MVRGSGIILAVAAAVSFGCSKTAQDGAQAPMKKIDTKMEGLPAAGAATGAATNPHAGGMPADSDPHATMGGENPHKGMGDMGAMGGMGGHGMVAEAGETDGNPVPLKKKGLGSAEELAKALTHVQGDDAKKTFEEGFRLTFAVDKSLRNIAKAKEDYEQLLAKQPDLAEAHRGLAYVAISSNFDVTTAEQHYEQALKLRPDYGEVHYALAFLYAQADKDKGAEHLKAALAAGISDEQGLKKVYGM